MDTKQAFPSEEGVSQANDGAVNGVTHQDAQDTGPSPMFDDDVDIEPSMLKLLRGALGETRIHLQAGMRLREGGHSAADECFDLARKSLADAIAALDIEGARASERGVLPNAFSFAALREANLARCVEFRDAQGRICHPGGVNDWTPSDWCMAVVGEVGEAANLLKKVRRGDLTATAAQHDVAMEFADAVTYLDLWAARCGVDLGAAVVEKFNKVSWRVQASVFIDSKTGEVVRLGSPAVSAAPVASGGLLGAIPEFVQAIRQSPSEQQGSGCDPRAGQAGGLSSAAGEASAEVRGSL